jgi:hypothetical protein
MGANMFVGLLFIHTATSCVGQSCYAAAGMSLHPPTILQRIRSVSGIFMNYCSERGSRQSSSNRVSWNDSGSCRVVEGARKTPRHLTVQEIRLSIHNALAGTFLGTSWGNVGNRRLIERC